MWLRVVAHSASSAQQSQHSSLLIQAVFVLQLRMQLGLGRLALLGTQLGTLA